MFIFKKLNPPLIFHFSLQPCILTNLKHFGIRFAVRITTPKTGCRRRMENIMTITGIIILTTICITIVSSIRGLFNKDRSIGCTLAGALTIMAALPGALHAWGEGQSIAWTSAYLILALVGAGSIFRQLMLHKQEQSLL